MGFRFFVQKSARKCGVTGKVRNNPDGTVYAEACGDQEQLGLFESAIKKGPALARVKEVIISELPSFTTKDFIIER